MILLLIIMDSRTKCLTVPLLMGNLFDETGDRLSPAFTVNHQGRRYRYYISNRLKVGRRKDPTGWREPAEQLEAIIQNHLTEMLADKAQLGVQSRSVGESVKLALHSGRSYRPSSSQERHDHARDPSCDTAIEGSAQRASHAVRPQPETVSKWRKRSFLDDAPMGPKAPRSTVLAPEEEAMAVAFRRHTLLPLDDCLYALQPTIPHLTRSSLHRCLQRHGISRLPDVEGDKPAKKKFKRYPIGYFHIDIAEVQRE